MNGSSNNAVLNTIQIMTEKIFNSINSSVIDILDNLVYIDRFSIQSHSFFPVYKKMMVAMKLVASSMIYGYILYYLISYLLTRINPDRTKVLENPIVFFFKAVIISILIDLSSEICLYVIDFNSALSDELMYAYFGDFASRFTFKMFLKNIDNVFFISADNVDIFSIQGILKGFASFGILNITVTFTLRQILIKILVLFSPFAFLTKVFSKTEKFFYLWLKSFVSLLLLQHFVTALLFLGNSLKIYTGITSSVYYQILYVGVIYGISQSSQLFEKMFGGFSPNIKVSFPFR